MDKAITKVKTVRENTSPLTNLRIDEKTFQNVKQYASSSDEELTQRIQELDDEWDIERVLGVNMSAVALTGIALSAKSRNWLAIPILVLGFFAQHALQGWCPPVTLFRYFKVRTRDEIDQEKHALKALRGDYADIKSAEEAYMAVKA